jgi:hypothetical protein
MVTITGQSVLLRPDSGHSFYEVPAALVTQAQQELALETVLVMAGVSEKLTPCQRLALMIFRDSGVTGEDIANMIGGEANKS